ncbi:hypothetical protein ANTRET_LOCUS7162 [Anthophora retusa]
MGNKEVKRRILLFAGAVTLNLLSSGLTLSDRLLKKVQQLNFMDILAAKVVTINAYNVVSDEGHENARWLSSTH